MSQPAVAALAPLPFELVYSDGEPLETEWHTLQFPLLRELIRQALTERERSDFFVGGNIFVYYSLQQAWEVKKGKKYFRGPDVFWVGDVESAGAARPWVSWEEGGRLPDVIIELLSPSTAEIDRNDKRDLHARVFQTPEYFLYEPETLKLEGLLLEGQAYRPIVPDERGRFWSSQLGVFLGLWHGVYEGHEDDWVRLFGADRSLVPTAEERAQAAQERAQAAEAEVARLRALLGERG